MLDAVVSWGKKQITFRSMCIIYVNVFHKCVIITIIKFNRYESVFADQTVLSDSESETENLPMFGHSHDRHRFLTVEVILGFIINLSALLGEVRGQVSGESRE